MTGRWRVWRLKYQDAKEQLDELDKRKVTILKTIEEQKLLTPELQSKIEQCYDLNELEDIYSPLSPNDVHVQQ